jgi:hypothetical protein
VEDHPEDLEAFSYLAKASYTLGDFPAMRRYLATLKTLAPQDVVTQQALAWSDHLPEAKAPTVEDEKNKILLNLARSVAEEKESPSPFSHTLVTKKAAPEESVLQSNAFSKEKKASVEVNPMPLVKEGWVDEKSSPPVDQRNASNNPPKPSNAQKENSASTPPSSSVGAAASVQAPASTTPLTQEQIAQNFQMLQQLMMMQMMSNSQNGFNSNNPMAMMMNGQGMNGMQGVNGMQGLSGLNMMNGQGMNPALNPQMMNQMMQNSMLNNMNGMFNTNTDNQNNNSGFGF